MLTTKNLKTTFKVEKDTITAVDGISIDIPESKTIGLVGESGSGKSVTALSIMNLLPKTATNSGEITWKNKLLTSLSPKKWQNIRGKEIGLIFQNPLASLNPVFSIGNQMIETIMLHHNSDKQTAKKTAIELLKKVNIPDAEERIHYYPHQFSLGMCQRIMIALTLSMQPDLLIADEPTASLDVTVQAQIMKLLADLQTEFKMSILLISHDLGLIAQSCDFIYIMYLGKIMEQGSPEHIFKTPLHPYTQALLEAIPNPDPNQESVTKPLKGDIPSPKNLPSGCRFHTRCPKAMAICKQKEPKLQAHNKAMISCFL